MKILVFMLILFPINSLSHESFEKDAGSVRDHDQGDYYDKIRIERQWEIEQKLIDEENEKEMERIFEKSEPYEYESLNFKDGVFGN